MLQAIDLYKAQWCDPKLKLKVVKLKGVNY